MRCWPMTALRELQAEFRRALLEGDDAAIAAAIRDDGIAAAERLAVYRNNVLTSLTAVLRDTFPATCRLVDERFFAYAADAFIRCHLPERACLADYGERFADFLASFPPCRALAYLPDVARLEWLLHCAAQAADTEPATLAALASVAPEDTAALRLNLRPALAYLRSPYPVDRLWQANRPGAAGDGSADLDAGAVQIEIDRDGETVIYRLLDAASFAWRQGLAAGLPLAAAAERALAENDQFDLAAALAELFRQGAVIAVVSPAAVPESPS
jgi:hypothetical protein